MVEKRQVPEVKKKQVEELAKKMRESNTFLIASTKGLPGSQFHQIKKKLRGKAEILVAKKTIVLRALEKVEKGAMKQIKDKIGADVALFFSSLDAFELSALLTDNQSASKARTGDIAPEDITIEAGGTDLLPGPAISELSAVGLKVAVENGKITIKNAHVVVKKGDVINEKVASVLGKLGISPMKVGFEPVAAFDAKSDATYFDIKIDKKGTLEALKEAIGKSFGFAVGLAYPTKETIGFILGKAGIQEMALDKIVESKEGAQ